MDSIASPTDAMEGDVGNPRELDDVDGFMADGDEIEIGDKDESIEIGAAKEDMEPIVPNTKDSRVPRALNAPIRPPGGPGGGRREPPHYSHPASIMV